MRPLPFIISSPLFSSSWGAYANLYAANGAYYASWMATSDRWIDSPRRPLLVSRRHAMLTYHADADTWVLEDLKSINGIFVNGKKVGRTRSTPTPSCSPS